MSLAMDGFGGGLSPDAEIAGFLTKRLAQIDADIAPLREQVGNTRAWLDSQIDQINAAEASSLAQLQGDWELEITGHLAPFRDEVERIEAHRAALLAELAEADEAISSKLQFLGDRERHLEAERDAALAGRREGFEAQRRQVIQKSRLADAEAELAALEGSRRSYQRKLDKLSGRGTSLSDRLASAAGLARELVSHRRRAVGAAVLASLIAGVVMWGGGGSVGEGSNPAQAAAVSLGQVTGHVQATGTPAWLPDTVKVWAPKLDQACRTQAIAVHGLNLSCTRAYRPILLTLALLDSAGNPDYTDPETGRRGLEPLDAKNGKAVAQLLHIRYRPSDGLTSLKIAARALNMDAYSALTSSKDIARYNQRGAVDVSKWCVSAVKHTGPAAVAFDLAHFWHPSYSCQYDAAVAQMFLDWKKPASAAFSANFSTPGMQQRLAEAMAVLKQTKVLS